MIHRVIIAIDPGYNTLGLCATILRTPFFTGLAPLLCTSCTYRTEKTTWQQHAERLKQFLLRNLQTITRKQKPIPLELFCIMEDFFPVGKRKGVTNMAKIVGYLQHFVEDFLTHCNGFQPPFLLVRPFQYKEKPLEQKAKEVKEYLYKEFSVNTQHEQDALDMVIYTYNLLLKGEISVL